MNWIALLNRLATVLQLLAAWWAGRQSARKRVTDDALKTARTAQNTAHTVARLSDTAVRDQLRKHWSRQ